MRSLRRTLIVAAFGFAAVTSCPAATASDVDFGSVLLALVVILIAAKLGGDLMIRIGQPPVLGELLFGIVIGNLYLLHFSTFAFIRDDASIRVLSDIGILLLLFEVGLDSNLDEMLSVGKSALTVATLGVIAPFVFGWASATLLLPKESTYTHVFIGATLCATSIGITARVLRDLGRMATPEARVILGAAVIDDVQGLIILAVVQSLIAASSHGQAVPGWSLALIVLKAVGFLFAAVFLGRRLAPWVVRLASKMLSPDLVLTLGLAACFAVAYSATLIGLAPIVGAFAAGIMLEDVHWRQFRQRGEHSVEETIKPLIAFLVPVFFVHIGTQVDLAQFARPGALLLTGALTVVAIAGKLVCGLGAWQQAMDKLTIGIGMIPRGEVGLIFAAIGTQITVGGRSVLEPGIFAAVVFVVMLTTLITPPLLNWSLSRERRGARS